MKNEPKRRQRTTMGNSGWPVQLALCESAIRKQDEYVFRGSPWWVDTSSKALLHGWKKTVR
ncbi:MAG TPA: hypothetical protein VIH78_08735 [Terriglobales bacterium]